MGVQHTRAARERRKREAEANGVGRARKYSAYDSAVMLLRKLSLMEKNRATADDDDDDGDDSRVRHDATCAHAPPPTSTKITRGGLVVSVGIDAAAQDEMIRRKRKSLALRLKERVMGTSVKPRPVTEGWSAEHRDDDDDDECGRRRGGCFC